MTDRSTMEILLKIADTLESIVQQQEMIISSLDTHSAAIKLLLDESIAREEPHTIFDDTDDVIAKFDRECRKYFEGIKHHDEEREK